MYKQLDTSEPLDRIVELNHRHINTSSSLLEPGIGGYERGHNEVTLFSHSLSLFIYFLSGDWKEWSRLIAVVETTTPCSPILEHQGYPRRKKGLCSKDQGREGGRGRSHIRKVLPRRQNLDGCTNRRSGIEKMQDWLSVAFVFLVSIFRTFMEHP